MKKVRFQKAPPKPVSGRESGIDIPSGIAYRTTNKNMNPEGSNLTVKNTFKQSQIGDSVGTFEIRKTEIGKAIFQNYRDVPFTQSSSMDKHGNILGVTKSHQTPKEPNRVNQYKKKKMPWESF